jgi:hypothetical protein
LGSAFDFEACLAGEFVKILGLRLLSTNYRIGIHKSEPSEWVIFKLQRQAKVTVTAESAWRVLQGLTMVNYVVGLLRRNGR